MTLEKKMATGTVMAAAIVLAGGCATTTDSAPPGQHSATTSPQTARAMVSAASQQAGHATDVHESTLTPEVIGIDDLMAVYSAYQAVSQILQSTATGTDPSAAIVAQLTDIQAQMADIESREQALVQALANLAYQDLRASYLATMQNVQTAQALAETASQQLSEWQATGKKKAHLLAEADDNSQIAANTLMQSSFYYRPPSVANAADIFDLRQVLVPYLYALTIRTSVIALEDPNFRCPSSGIGGLGNKCVMPYQGEFQAHLDWLNQLQGLNQGNIQRSSLINGYQDSFQICSFATDTNSGFSSVIDGLYPAPSQPTCTETWYGDATVQNDALEYLSFWDDWNVEEEMGIHVIQDTAQTVALDATEDWSMPIGMCFPMPGHPCPPVYRPLGPIVSNDGQCLSNGTTVTGVFFPGLVLAACDHSASQTWQTASARGQTGQVSLADGSGCLEVPEWNESNSPDVEACSNSPGEPFTIGSTNELQWGRDESQCLTAESGGVVLAPCDGSAEQHWSRFWK